LRGGAPLTPLADAGDEDSDLVARKNGLQVLDLVSLDGTLRQDDDVDVVDLVARRDQRPGTTPVEVERE
jgi:hypothetical protein